MEFEVIGIYLPPHDVIAARAAHEAGSVSAARLKEVEDEAVRDIVRRQLDCGLSAVTSGGIRWKYWDKDFFFGLSGITKEWLDSGHVYSNDNAFTDIMRCTGRIAFNPAHPCLEDFRFLADTVAGRAVCRQIIPSPAELYMRLLLMDDGHPSRIYPDAGQMLRDIADAYRHTIAALYRLGCRSIVFDDTVCGRLCQDSFTKRLLQGGIDVMELQDAIIRLMNESFAGAPADLGKALYLSGADAIVPKWECMEYPDNIMPRVLYGVDADRFFLPFDTGDDYPIEILRHVPAGKNVVLGLIDAHTPFPDDEEAIMHLVEKARRHISSGRLAISPKTGFRLSSYAPRGLDSNDQWRKIRTLAALAAGMA